MIMKTGFLENFFILSADLLTDYTNKLLGLIGATLSIAPVVPIVLLEFIKKTHHTINHKTPQNRCKRTKERYKKESV